MVDIEADQIQTGLLLKEIGPKDFERADWKLLADRLVRWAATDLPASIPDQPWTAKLGCIVNIDYRTPCHDELAAETKRRVGEARDRLAV
ncbi:hypothetical protein [Nocardioides sp.]|uniref:hypothetical protein n=1 Tax=Nocardioides sp. TaxID=35761 RepID=UPI0026074338|nr:hypothetical protein [Nocardioides sp.]